MLPQKFPDICVRPETIKLLEENIGKTHSDINHSRILYDPSPRILEIKAKINKWDLIKLKGFCTTKETIRMVKREPSEWEKIIADMPSRWEERCPPPFVGLCFSAAASSCPTFSKIWVRPPIN